MKIKTFLILAGLLSLARTGFAQCDPDDPCVIVQNGNFSDFPAATPASGTNLTAGNSCQWQPAFGSPMYNAFSTSAPLATYMWSVVDNGEGVLQNLNTPVVNGVTYYLSYQRRMLPNNPLDADLLDNYFIRLAQAGTSGLPVTGTVIPAVPAPSQLIANEANIATAAGYTFQERCFVADDNYDQFYFYPHETSANQKWLLIDDIFLARLADAGPDQTANCGASVTLGPACPIPGATYNWVSSPFDATLTPTVANPTVTPTVTTTYTVTVTSPGGLCTATDVVVVTVNPTITATIASSAGPGPFCETDPAFSIISTPITDGGGTGTFSSSTSSPLTNGFLNLFTFNPAGNPGTHTYTFTFTTAAGCVSSASLTFTVDPAIIITTLPVPPVCSNDPLFSLLPYVTSTAPGTFSGPGVTGSDFDPAVAGTGTHTITFSATSGACTNSQNLSVTVLPASWQQTSSMTNGNEIGRDVTTDASGNIYVTGDIMSLTNFGSGANMINILGAGMYVAKYDPCGNLLWIAHTQNGYAKGKGIIVNSVDGHVIVTGEINSSSSAGTEVFVNAYANVPTACTPGAPAGSVTLDKTSYLAKYDMDDGCLIEVNGYGNITSNIIKYQSVDCTPGAGYGLFVCGYKQTNPTTKQAMIAKHTSGAGMPMNWQVISGGTSGFDRIATDIDYLGGPIYVTGTFSRDMTWGALTLTLTAASDAFVYKFNNSALPPPAIFARKGNVVAPGTATGNSITVDPAGNVYVTGQFRNGFSAAFSGPALPASSGLTEAYVCKITPAGVCSWAQRIYSTTAVAGSGISADGTHVYVTGNYYGQYLNFPSGTSIVSNQIPPSPPLTNYFVTKMASGTGIDVWANISEGLNKHVSNGIRVHGGYAYTTGGYLGTMHLPPYFAPPMGIITQTGSGMNAFLNRNDGTTGTFRLQENEQASPVDFGQIALQLQAFPNPSDGLFTLETLGETATDVLTIDVYNSVGQLVISKQVNSSERRYMIDLRSHDKGMYFVRISNGTQTAHTRVLTR